MADMTKAEAGDGRSDEDWWTTPAAEATADPAPPGEPSTSPDTDATAGGDPAAAAGTSGRTGEPDSEPTLPSPPGRPWADVAAAAATRDEHTGAPDPTRPGDVIEPAEAVEPVGRARPYDEPPRTRSAPPGRPVPPRAETPAPMLRRDPLPAPVAAPNLAAVDTAQLPLATGEHGESDADTFDGNDLGLLGLGPIELPAAHGHVPHQQRRYPGPPGRTIRSPRPPRQPRSPWVALPGLLVLAVLAAFFGWVSAEPLWLTVGHGHTGTVTVQAAGVDCRGAFVADGGAFTVSSVDVAGLAPADCRPGAAHVARMVSADANYAYAVSSHGLIMRWAVGLILVLLCGLLIAWITGAFRFTGWRRPAAALLSVGVPVGLLGIMLALAY